MPQVTANGIRISYEERGRGPAAVWAHGLCGTLRTWEGIMARLQDRCRVIAYDARGHGASEKPPDAAAYSQDLMVEDLRGLLDALGVERAVVGGHSMGANVALNVALRHPGRCLGLVAVGIGSGSSDPEEWRTSMGQTAEVAEREGMAATLEAMRRRPAWAPAFSRPDVAPLVTREVLGCDPQAIAHTIRGVQMRRPTIFQLEEGLRRLPVPTLVVLGELDGPVLECSRFMAQRIPQAELVAIPGAGHWVHLEAPGPFLEAVERFVARLPLERVRG